MLKVIPSRTIRLLLIAAALPLAISCGGNPSETRQNQGSPMNQKTTGDNPAPGSKCPYRLDGRPDAEHGWTYLAETEGKKVYIPFEGYYESKGGRMQSPRFHLGKAPGKAGFFRLRFQAKAPVQGFWWVDLFDGNGKILPDINSALYASEKMIPYDEIIFTSSQAEYAQIAFVTKQGVVVQNIVLEAVTPQEAADWCDRVYAGITDKTYTPPSDGFARLPKTREALLTGKPWRIVMLGDSSVNDTWNSNFQSLVMRDFPDAKLDFILSVRGSTGCWYYREAENFRQYVTDLKPDLVMIGGVSNAPDDPAKGDPEKNMLEVIRRCRELGCEVLVMSPPRSKEWRTSPDRKAVWSETAYDPRKVKLLRQDYQRAAVAATGTAYWDLTSWPCGIVGESCKPLGWFNRDPGGHNNDRGKQLLGQTLAGWFRTAKN
ncbi:MAG: hypothetical protein J5806_15160 [Lentisphaeria bacterium]|nr:hypothetical protein [Lentisphaeria bacterium]